LIRKNPSWTGRALNMRREYQRSFRFTTEGKKGKFRREAWEIGQI
jgi:hypothetical protein